MMFRELIMKESICQFHANCGFIFWYSKKIEYIRVFSDSIFCSIGYLNWKRKSSFTFTKNLRHIDKMFSSTFLRCQLTNKSKCDNLSRMMMTIQWVVNIQHAFLWHYTTHKIDNGPSRKMGIVLNVKICF